MNYEDLYKEYQTLGKSLKEENGVVARLTKTIEKEMEAGDLKSFDKDVKQLADAIAEQSRLTEEIRALVDSFDRSAYFNGGDFAVQMLEACKEKQVDVQGEFPVYEMFPYKVKLDAENLDVYMDRKKIQCFRPKSLVTKIIDGQIRLNKVAFNAVSFLSEMETAYDLAVLKLKKKPGAEIYLTRLYKFMVPMSRSRRDYDMQSFAFDLARLYISKEDTAKDGRRSAFGPSRDGSQAIRILDDYGHEQYLSTIKFFND